MPSEVKKIGTLEIEPSANHLDTHFLLIQKIGIGIMSMILCAGILGFFGTGIFGKSKIKGSSIQVQYNKFVRLQATNVFHITTSFINTKYAPNTIKLAISSDFFKKVSIKSINPEPAEQEIRDNKIIYTFSVSQTQGYVPITIVVEPEEFGKLEFDLGIIAPKSEIVKIHQFIYP